MLSMSSGRRGYDLDGKQRQRQEEGKQEKEEGEWQEEAGEGEGFGNRVRRVEKEGVRTKKG